MLFLLSGKCVKKTVIFGIHNETMFSLFVYYCNSGTRTDSALCCYPNGAVKSMSAVGNWIPNCQQLRRWCWKTIMDSRRTGKGADFTRYLRISPFSKDLPIVTTFDFKIFQPHWKRLYKCCRAIARWKMEEGRGKNDAYKSLSVSP
jgi:hypothetical protein